jgi:hypothetical protein
MLLRRGRPKTMRERARAALWPARGWRRSARYFVLRVARLDAGPHAVGLGLAVGVFAAFLPVVGFQMLFAAAAAWLLRASVAAALIGTFVGGPVTWPAMWLASYELGALIVGESRAVTVPELWTALTSIAAAAGSDGRAAMAGELFWRILKPLGIGAVLLGALAGSLFYAMVTRAARHARR